ncbi:Minf_1886 family protein [Candidatus Omnitrophota bacterium]
MSAIEDYLGKIDAILEKHKEYKGEAYYFVMSALNHTITKMGEQRHLTGQELCVGIKDYAHEQFGPLSQTVLKYWGLKETFDFGKIVYYLIDSKLMNKTDEDSIEDFRDVYNFDEVFGKNYNYLAIENEL